MYYTFPTITHIDDVREAIASSPEFFIAEREHYSVVNYMVSTPTTFPPVKEIRVTIGDDPTVVHQDRDAAIRRECRGMIFGLDGKIISRRLHKFFNVNERDETHLDYVDLNRPHVILEKLDGSMVTPIPIGDQIRWGTKMGITGVSMGAEEFVASRPHYRAFAQFMINIGCTPIFEWCSRSQRIVIDYPEDRLVLIAIRKIETGEYFPFAAMKKWAEDNSIDCVKAYSGTEQSMSSLIASTKSAEGIEGWVVRFDDGHMVKVKGDWYVRIHRVKDSLQHEKNLIHLIVNGALDDTKPLLMAEDLVRVEAFEKQFWNGFYQLRDQINTHLDIFQSAGMDKKTFAIHHSIKFAPLIRSVLFSCWDNAKAPGDVMLDRIRNSLGSQSRVDSVRGLWGGAQWVYSIDS